MLTAAKYSTDDSGVKRVIMKITTDESGNIKQEIVEHINFTECTAESAQLVEMPGMTVEIAGNKYHIDPSFWAMQKEQVSPKVTYEDGNEDVNLDYSPDIDMSSIQNTNKNLEKEKSEDEEDELDFSDFMMEDL